MAARLVALVGALLLVGGAAVAQTPLEHGRFEHVVLVRPTAALNGVVLLLSGGSTDSAQQAVARALASRGALVVAVDVPAFFQRLESDSAACEFADGDLENLSHFAQGYAQLPSYFRPWLVGTGPGAALAYAVLAQAPPGTFAGAISVGFRPQLPLRKPLCPDNALRASPAAATATLLPPARGLSAPWVVLQCGPPGCGGEAAAFVAATRGAAMAVLPGLAAAPTEPSAFLGALLAAHEKLAAAISTAEPPPPASLDDLPLIEVPAKGAGSTFVVFLSGDGGWAGLDKSLATQLSAQGLRVVGLDSLRYFWKARTPERVGADVDRIVRFYSARWRCAHTLLVGYSQGADVLPFAVNRLSASARRTVSGVVLLSPELRASFEFHLSHWIASPASGLPILPEALKLDPRTTLCINGAADQKLCPLLSPHHARVLVTPGDHHFDGDYPKLAQLILDHVPRREPHVGSTSQTD